MLKQETVDAFAKFAGIEPSDLMEKIKSESEEDITLPEVQIFTNDELDSRIKNEKSTSYNEGKDAGVEMLVKSKKTELGYEFEGKDFNSLLDFHTEKIKGSYGKPNEKITELENDLKNVNQAHEQALIEREGRYNDMVSKYNNVILQTEILQVVPEDTTIPKNDLVTLFRAEYEVVKEDGKTVVRKNGETLKDAKTATPLSIKDVMINYGTEKKYISSQGGRGAGNEFGANSVSTNSIAAFNENWMKSNNSMNTPEYSAAYNAWSEKVGSKKVA